MKGVDLQRVAKLLDLKEKPAETTLQEIERLDFAVENVKSDINVIQDDAQKIVEAIGELEQAKATKQELEYAMASVQTQKGDRGFKGEKGDTGAAGKDGRDGINGKNGIDGVDGKNGLDGKDGLNAVVDYEKVVNDVTQLVHFETDSAEDIRNKLEVLQGEERLDKSAIKGIKEIEDSIKEVGNTYIQQGGVSEAQVLRLIEENDITHDTLQGVTDRGATTDNIITVPGVQFDITATPATNAEGLLQWNATDGTLDLGMDGGAIAMQIGQEIFMKVRNVSGSTIPNGSLVYLSGRTGNRPNIYLARADVSATHEVIGLTTQDIASPADGFITTLGYVRGIKTDYSGTGAWGTTWVEGDPLWLSKTVAGCVTNVEPDVPHYSDRIGYVGVVGGAGIGSILITIVPSVNLENLSDVNGTTLTTDGQFPSWHQTEGYFDFDKNINDYLPTATAATTYAKLDGTNHPFTYVKTPNIRPNANSTTAVQITKADGTTSVLNVDTTNSRVGIGTTAPNTKLEVTGSGTSGDITLSNSSSAITAGDILGKIAFRNYDISQNVTTFSGEVASIKAVASSTFFSANGATTDLSFFTNAVTPASGNPVNGGTEKMRITGTGKVGIGTTTPSARLHSLSTTEQLRLGYDASKYLSVTVGSANAVTLANAVAADININCGADKTLVLTESVWVDIDFPILIRTTGAGIPTLTTFNGNLTMPQWAVNDFNVCESQEFIHEWKEGSTCYWHIHVNTNGLDATNRYLKFELEYAYSVAGVWTFPAVVTTADILIPANTPDKSQIIMSLANFTPTNTKIGDHCIARLKRVTATGTAPTNNPWIPMLQMHIEKDTIGSRQIGVK